MKFRTPSPRETAAALLEALANVAWAAGDGRESHALQAACSVLRDEPVTESELAAFQSYLADTATLDTTQNPEAF